MPIEELIKLISGMGLLGMDSLEGALGSAVGGTVPGAMLQGGPEAAATALLGGGAAGALARQLPMNDIADAASSLISKGGAAGAAMGAIPGIRNLPPAAAASLAGGAAGDVLTEREKMLRRMMGIYA